MMWLETFEYLLSMDSQAKQRLAELIIEAQGHQSQRKFAIALGVNPATLKNWIDGQGSPSPENLEKIAKATGFEGIDDLLEHLRGIQGEKKVASIEQILLLAKNLPKEDRKKLTKMLIDLD
ncbi:helix-turn-helix transcriptional regulator [Nostoc sp.]|uniref:helix-turn-helix transcriptional regulator n=1 Tax=Nostoc sp. TaxID=1180 RepID=UPI002FFD0CD8